MQWLQLGWLAGGLTRKGLVASYVAVSVGAAPPRSCAIGSVIVQTAMPLHESEKPSPVNPQKCPVTGSGPSSVLTKVSVFPALPSRVIAGFTVSARNGPVAPAMPGPLDLSFK